MGDEFALPNPFVLLLVILIGAAASVGLAVSAVIRMVRFVRCPQVRLFPHRDVGQMNTPQVSRRVVLTTTAATAVALPAAQLLPGSANAAGRRAAPQPDQRSPRAPTGRPSRNGWEMESAVDHGGSIYTRPVPGTPLD